ncbi:Cytochrome P450 4c3 [Halotydeus destructor]|nr:Cytochrome P450 4c3 [Halotydeus destructor]
MSAILKSFFTTVNPVIVFRYIAITSSVSFLIYHLVKKLQIWLTACRNIDKIPGPAKFSFLLGNIPMDIIKYVGAEYEKSKDLYYSLLQALRGYTQVYQRERIFRLWVGWEPWVVLWRPESCEQIFADNFLLDKSSQYDFLHPWLGTGLLTSSGPKWRSRRKLLVPAFHFKILHDFVPVFNEQAAIMVDKLRDTAHRGWPIDITPVVTACALDIICEWANVGSSASYSPATGQTSCTTCPKVGETSRPTLAHLHKFTRKVIRERKEQIVSRDTQTYTIDAGQREEPSRKAFLDLLLDHHLTTGELTMEDIREEVDTFMFEGHDTTAMALSWILFLLGHHPEVQEKVWPEVDSLFDSADNEPTSISGSSGNAHITLDKVKELKQDGQDNVQYGNGLEAEASSQSSTTRAPSVERGDKEKSEPPVDGVNCLHLGSGVILFGVSVFSHGLSPYLS